MSPTLNYHKTSDRKIDFRLNNNLNISNNLIFDNNLIFESMPDLQPILDFDDGEGMDEVDGNTLSNGDYHSNDNHRNNEGLTPKSSKKKESESQIVRKQAPTFLLIESLIWNFCCSHETDRQKQKLLFESLCEHLNTLKLIGSSYKSGSLQPIREFIVKKFNELLVEIKTHDKRFNSLLSSCNPIPNTIIYNSPHLIHQSRYRDDFEDLGLIDDTGGFGVVNKAKNRFDDCEYAVKMIRFKYTDKYDSVFKNIIREVQLYANLSSHPNVVAYKTAWLENWCHHNQSIPLNGITNGINKNNQFLNGMDDMLNTSERYSKDTENDVSIRFEESSKSGIRIESSNVQINGTLECNQKIEIQTKEEEEEEEESSSDDENSSDSNGSMETYKMLSLSDLSSIKQSIVKRKKTFSMSSTQSQSDSAVEYRDTFVLQKYHNRDIPDIKIDDFQANDCPFACSNFGAVLYIQMELCGKNLKTWLRTRNDRIFALFSEHKRKQKPENKSISPNAIDFMDSEDQKEAKNIFRQVLKGVEYIHSQHLIHRDLKPQNILFNIDGSKVKIGDFGLATLHNSIIDSEVISMFKQSTPSTSTATDGHNNLNHTGNIGTSIYASPEQKSRKDYDNKTDLFSLGIILFELFYPLSTEMEKANCVSNITKNQVLPKSLVKSCPNVAKIILGLTHPNPICRPNASDLLHSLLFLTEEQIFIRQTEDQNKQLINELVAKQNKIKELENSLQFERTISAQKDKEIENLRKQLEVMTENMKFS